MGREREWGSDALRLDGPEGPCDVPVKLRVHDSLFVPLAKWSMLLTGNYRCITAGAPRPIREAVHADLDRSRAIYAHVDALPRRLGADAADQVPFEKYARPRPEERRVGKECVSTCRSGGSPYHHKNKNRNWA